MFTVIPASPLHRYLAQLNALRCVTFRTSDTIHGGRSLPARFLPAEKTEHRTE